MKAKLLVSLAVLIAMVMLFQPACKSEEGCEFSILGTWSISITIPDWFGTISETWVFSGSETGGTITGYAYYPGQTGSYTVTACSVVQLMFNYHDSYWGNTNITFNGTLTSANMMNGTGTWTDDWGTLSLSWTGTKVM